MCSILSHYLDYHFVFTGTINYLPEMIKLELNQPHGKWRLTEVQKECKTGFTCHVVDERMHFELKE